MDKNFNSQNKEKMNEEELAKQWEKEQKEEENYILKVQAEHPIGNEPFYVLVRYSEYKAFYRWNDDNWDKNGKLELSITAADIIFDHFDKIVHEKNKGEGYDKLGYLIINKRTGETIFDDRYDLGDLNGGLIKWFITINAPILKEIENETNNNKSKNIKNSTNTENNMITEEKLETITNEIEKDNNETTDNRPENYREIDALLEKNTYNILPITPFQYNMIKEKTKKELIEKLAKMEMNKKITEETIKTMKKTKLYKRMHIKLIIENAFSN